MIYCSRECKKSKLYPQLKTVSNQPSTISPAPKPLRLDRSTIAPTNPPTFRLFKRFFSKMPTNLSLRQPHRQREYQRCPGGPGPPVAPLGRLDYRTRLLSNRRPPAPAFYFAGVLRVGVRSIIRGIMNVKHLAT
jgi:hypothetical protein